MSSRNRIVTATMLLLALAILVSFSIISAQSIAKPSPPQFTLTYAKHPYDTPATYTTDPYTGKSVVSDGGYHYANESIEVKIRNQPVTPEVDATGNKTSLFYSFRFKGHFSSDWIDYRDYYYDGASDHHFLNEGYFNASDSEYTIAALRDIVLGNLREDAQIDIQVRALMGHVDQVPYWTYMGNGYEPKFVGEMSDWSTTQKITIRNAATANPTATPQPFATETVTPTENPTQTTPQENPMTDLMGSFSWEKAAILALAVTVAVLSLGMLMLWRRIPSK